MHPALGALGVLALLDSLNPSALIVTLYLLSGSRPTRTVTAYMAGVFITYLGIGILLMLGLDALITAYRDFMWGPTAYAAQALIGAAMLIYSLLADSRKPSETEQRLANVTSLAGLVVLGSVVTVVELTTALPYLGATGLLATLDWPVAYWLPALVAYNLIFIAPPFLLLVAHLWLGSWLEGRKASLKAKLERAGRETALWVIGIVGFFLLVDALVYFDFFGLIPQELADEVPSLSEGYFRRRINP